MKKLFISGGIFILFALLNSCSTTKLPESEVAPVYITNTKKFYLLHPAELENPVDAQQLLNGSFGSSSFSLLAYTQADENGIFMSLFNDFGTSMGNLSYDGIRVSFDSAIFPKALKAEYIVADLQFAYYKLDAVKKALSEVHLTVSETEENGVVVRKILNGKKCIEVITKNGNVLTILNNLRGYKYILEEASE